MKQYRFDEHGKGYKLGKTLQSFRPEFQPIIRLIPKNSTVLDVGCGDGILGQMLIKEKDCIVFGCDLDVIGVKESKRKGIKARVWDINEKLPYASNSFDIVVCNVVMAFIERPNQLTAELFRVSKGRVIVSISNFGFWMYRIQMLFGKFPTLSLFGHTWWNTRMIKFFSLNDYLDLPSLKGKNTNKLIGIDWKNRNFGLLATMFPNFFSRACILEFIK